jgi:two-component system, NarL family, nitrate/nitrite sensor histidine kinase NarX
LSISWKLEGGAAAINDTGGLRIRTYRIAHQLARADTEMRDPAAFSALLKEELEGIETILRSLAEGDPGRPLFVPQDRGIPEDVVRFTDFWTSRIRPVLFVLISRSEPRHSATHHA